MTFSHVDFFIFIDKLLVFNEENKKIDESGYESQEKNGAKAFKAAIYATESTGHMLVD